MQTIIVALTRPLSLARPALGLALKEVAQTSFGASSLSAHSFAGANLKRAAEVLGNPHQTGSRRGLNTDGRSFEEAPSLSRVANHLPEMRSVSMRYILQYGSQPKDKHMLISARFLHQELPVRLAHRILELSSLPKALAETSHVKQVKSWYSESFAELRRFPEVKDYQDVSDFTQMLRSAYCQRHAYVVPAMAKGVEEYRRGLQVTDSRNTASAQRDLDKDDADIQVFLNNFFLSRIALRFLAGHHIALYDQANGNEGAPPCTPNTIGLIDMKCSPWKVIQDAVNEACEICEESFGRAPEVNLHGSPNITLAFNPEHLRFMVFELVKNSLRATMISDQGGGIPRSDLSQIFKYLYTTARNPLPDVGSDYTCLPNVLAGYGCGLPLSQLHAKYFGGDLQIFSMQGYGTDAYLHLLRLGSDEELLPQ
eukprot:gene26054-11754_t